MNYKELVEMLRDMSRAIIRDDAKELGVPEDLITDVGAEACNDAANMITELRNELCYRCGQYATAHLGSCDGCKWRDG